MVSSVELNPVAGLSKQDTNRYSSAIVRVPAPAIVLSCTNLSTDESLLTGESLPVRFHCIWRKHRNGSSRGR